MEEWLVAETLAAETLYGAHQKRAEYDRSDLGLSVGGQLITLNFRTPRAPRESLTGPLVETTSWWNPVVPPEDVDDLFARGVAAPVVRFDFDSKRRETEKLVYAWKDADWFVPKDLLLERFSNNRAVLEFLSLRLAKPPTEDMGVNYVQAALFMLHLPAQLIPALPPGLLTHSSLDGTLVLRPGITPLDAVAWFAVTYDMMHPLHFVAYRMLLARNVFNEAQHLPSIGKIWNQELRNAMNVELPLLDLGNVTKANLQDARRALQYSFTCLLRFAVWSGSIFTTTPTGDLQAVLREDVPSRLYRVSRVITNFTNAPFFGNVVRAMRVDTTWDSLRQLAYDTVIEHGNGRRPDGQKSLHAFFMKRVCVKTIERVRERMAETKLADAAARTARAAAVAPGIDAAGVAARASVAASLASGVDSFLIVDTAAAAAGAAAAAAAAAGVVDPAAVGTAANNAAVAAMLAGNGDARAAAAAGAAAAKEKIAGRRDNAVVAAGAAAANAFLAAKAVNAFPAVVDIAATAAGDAAAAASAAAPPPFAPALVVTSAAAAGAAAAAVAVATAAAAAVEPGTVRRAEAAAAAAADANAAAAAADVIVIAEAVRAARDADASGIAAAAAAAQAVVNGNAAAVTAVAIDAAIRGIDPGVADTAAGATSDAVASTRAVADAVASRVARAAIAGPPAPGAQNAEEQVTQLLAEAARSYMIRRANAMLRGFRLHPETLPPVGGGLDPPGVVNALWTNLFPATKELFIQTAVATVNVMVDAVESGNVLAPRDVVGRLMHSGDTVVGPHVLMTRQEKQRCFAELRDYMWKVSERGASQLWSGYLGTCKDCG